MNMKFNTAVKAIAIAAALAFSNAGHAASIVGHMSAFEYVNFDASFSGAPGKTIEPWKLDVSGSETLAFCIDRDTQAYFNVNYGGAGVVPAQAIIGLYETSYSKVLNNGAYNANNAAAFQLALWEVLDNKNFSSGALILPTSGGVLPDNDEVAILAHGMLNDALSYAGQGGNYAYTEYTAAGSQTLLSVSAVPEADSWAMMAVGLGLLGVVGRRKQKNEKFA